MAKTVSIRGITYPDEQAAADAFGLNRRTVVNAIRKGRQDFIGIPAHKTRKRTGQEPMKVRVAGKEYTDAKAAAAAHGVKVKTIYSALCRGGEEYVGLGQKRPHRKRRPDQKTCAKPVQIGSLSFRSIKAASAFLGCSRTTLKKHLTEGNTEWLAARAMAAQARAEGKRKALPTSHDRDAESARMLGLWQKRKAGAEIKERMTA